jgi:hypothetical protein
MSKLKLVLRNYLAKTPAKKIELGLRGGFCRQ